MVMFFFELPMNISLQLASWPFFPTWAEETQTLCSSSVLHSLDLTPTNQMDFFEKASERQEDWAGTSHCSLFAGLLQRQQTLSCPARRILDCFAFLFIFIIKIKPKN